MLKRSVPQRYMQILQYITRPPISGYEIAELPDEQVHKEFLQVHKDKLVITVLHSGDSRRVEDDVVSNGFVASLKRNNFGNPSLVRFALVPASFAPKLVEEHAVLTYPTSLIFYGGHVCERVVGARARELMIKCLFKLRNENKNIFAGSMSSVPTATTK